MALLLGLACSPLSKWRGTDAFIARLKCHMSEEDVAAVAASCPDLDLRRTETSNLGQMAGFKANTRVSLEFDGEGLFRVGVSWNDGILSSAYEPKINLCSGVRSVWLVVHAPDELEGATIYVDGQSSGSISRAGTAFVDVPLGDHELQVKKRCFLVWSATVTFSQSDPGYQHITVPLLQRDPNTCPAP
ncbi:MAG TPA: PEGA domain-containing protein [Thermoanaerobaculia bacterium]|nr:PEGA domain-containing protein [Thermoanaerobaculia bacterium]